MAPSDRITWLGSPESRILSIRQFRKHIDTLDLLPAVKLAQSVWMNSPRIQKELFNLQDVKSWPNPWELFSQPVFCKNSVAVGLFYTFILSKHATDHTINFVIINDSLYGLKGDIIFDTNILTGGQVVGIIKEDDIREKLGE